LTSKVRACFEAWVSFNSRHRNFREWIVEVRTVRVDCGGVKTKRRIQRKAAEAEQDCPLNAGKCCCDTEEKETRAAPHVCSKTKL